MILIDDHAWCATRIYVMSVISPDNTIPLHIPELKGVMSDEQNA